MAGTRRFKDPTETTAKLTVLVLIDMDRQLRTLAAHQGIGVGTMIRDWLTEKLAPPKSGRRTKAVLNTRDQASSGGHTAA